MVNLLRGDLGLSLAMRGHTVTDIIASAFPVSLDLGIRAMILSIVFGIGFGVVAALKRGTAFDYLTVVLVLIGISVPSFVLAGLLQYYLGVYLHILPIARYESFSYTIMPSIALSLGTMATIARYMRSSMLKLSVCGLHQDGACQGSEAAPGRAPAPDSETYLAGVADSGSSRRLGADRVFRGRDGVRHSGARTVLRHRHAEPGLYAGDGSHDLLRRFLIGMNFLVDLAYGLIDPRIRTS